MFIDVLGVTGHRPDKLGGYDEEVFDRLCIFAKQELARLAPQYVITGMAIGWDQAVAIAAKKLGIPYIAYIPFVGQESRWPDYAQERYQALMKKAFKVENCGGHGYHPSKMFARNERIVNDSDVVLCLWNGTSGGTANCVDYANRQDVPLINCWDNFDKFINKKKPVAVRRAHAPSSR